MKKQLLLAALFIAVTVLPLAAQRRAALVPADTSIVLNEIMYSPPVGANAMTDEYIEVYNTGIVAIDLRNWKFNAGTALTLNDSSNSGVGATILPSGGYALILGNGYYTGATRYYNSRAPVGTLFLRASGALGLLNDGEAVTLSNPADDMTSTHTYTGGGANGRSREKIVPSRNDAASNWQQTLIADGTPGAKNSVSPRDLDAQNLRVRFAPSDSVAVGTAVTISSVIKNNGLLALTAFSVEFYDDANNDGVLSAPERFSTQTFNGSVLRNDSTTLTAPLATPNAATRRIGTIVQLSGDELRANDTARAVLGVVAPVVNNPLDTHLVLNEILYAPTSPKPEFIEIFNKSATDSIKINGLRVGDRAASAQAIEDGGADIYLRAQQYAVIFGRSDSATSRNFFIPSDARKLFSRASTLSLNNMNGDTVFVINAAGTELARFRYTGNEADGRSLEKIIPNRSDISTNYTVCVGDSVATPGRRNSVTPFERDLALRVNPLFFTPPATPVNLSYTVLNRGSQTFGNGTVVRLFNDANNNSVPEPAEQINSATLTQNFFTKDSLVSAFNFTPTSLDTVRFIFTLSNAQDQSTLNDTARTKLGISDTSIVLNEILYRPPSGFDSGNNEFLELFNTSGTKSVDLRNWKVAGSVTTPLVLTDSGATGFGQTTLAPRSYAVILPSGYFSDTTRLYRDLIPTGALVLRASGSLSLNDGGDNIIIISAGGDTAAKFLYPDKATQGFSLEKIISNRTDDTTNYAASLIQRGTPGAQNSVAPKNIDVQNLRLQLSPPDSAAINTTVTASSVVRNRGLLPAAPFSVSFYSDANLNGTLEPSEIFSTQNFGGTLAPNDSTSFTAPLPATPAGTRTIATVVSLTGDEFRQNDTLRTSYKIFVPSVSNPADTNLVLNEIMYAPASPKPEFIELYNKSATDSIKVNGLRVGDRSSSNTAIDAGSSDKYLKPLQYAVVLARGDSATGVANYAIPSGALILIKTNSLGLNNDGDTVFVINAAGTQLATYPYKATSATNGRSLEKIIPNRTDDTTNYAASEDATLSTPGRRNSVTPFNRDLAIKTNATVFTAPNTPVNLNYTVTNRGAETFGNGTVVRLFNDINNNSVPETGEQINSLTLSANLAPKDSLTGAFNFTPNSLDTARFIFALSNAQDQNALNDTARTKLAISDTSIVLNEIMYDPPTGANTTTDEFIELYNASSTKSIDLRNWRVADASGAVTLTDSSGTGTGQTVLAPNGYAVILGSGYFTGAARYYKDIIPAGALVLRASASLGLTNTTDLIAVVSASGDTVAKYAYRGNDKNKGLSLEKIISNRFDDSTNYAPSFVQPGTPGRRNSANPRDRDLALRVPIQFSTPPNTAASLPIAVVNRGLLNFGNGAVVKLFVDQNRNGIAEPAEEQAAQTLTADLAPGDSSRRTFAFTPASPDTVRLLFTLSIAQDEDTTTNFSQSILLTGARRQSVVVNEILYAPIQSSTDFKQDQPDYIELYNPTDAPVDLRGWYLTNLPNERGEFDRYTFATDTAKSYVLNSREYAVVSPDTSLARDTTRLIRFYKYLQGSSVKIFFITSRSTFSNSEDGLVQLVDNTDGIVDSVRYFDSWNSPLISETRGKSLEKINPDFASNDRRSWTTAVDRDYGGTPGKQNSVFATSLVGNGSSISISPNPFSPDADGRDDNAVIAFTLPGVDNRLRVKIYDVKGRLVRTVANAERATQQGSVVWDGLDDNRQSLRVGIYVVFLEALDANAAVVQTARTTVVLARYMSR